MVVSSNCGSVQKTFCFIGNGFAPVGSLKDKFNTFILKNKLIAKSIEGSLQPQKSSLEQLETMVLVLK
jgi:hypothetical protein